MGVKETDDKLTADYDLNDTVYRGITHTNTDNLSQKITGSSRSGSDKYSNNYLLTTETERSFETRRASYKHVNGIYTHIYSNGIRAFKVSVGYVTTSTHLVQGLVVVKNRANGQGIKKTNRQLWEFSHSYTISRWEGEDVKLLKL